MRLRAFNARPASFKISPGRTPAVRVQHRLLAALAVLLARAKGTIAYFKRVMGGVSVDLGSSSTTRVSSLLVKQMEQLTASQ